ncbi:MAG: NADPH:quinone reductase-like Zn-dependent oxidoreductase [Arenicella sp.]|jgi:NADPH:quinone reductase-like Zn-dependent oxidoreductase
MLTEFILMKRRYKILNGIAIFFVLLFTVIGFILSYTADCEPRTETVEQADSMQAIVASCYGAPEVLELVTVTKPIPVDNEILVKVHAASVNPADWHRMRGSPYIMRLMTGIAAPKSDKVGTDFSGVVEAVGKDVTMFKVGDAVFGGRSGAYAEYLTMPENRAVALKPANITHEQAAAVPMAALTALQAVRDKGLVQAGHKVLINGASGGVGTNAVQIAKALGAEVTGVNSTRNVEMVLSIGADYVIDYKKDDFTTQDIKYDVILDMVGNHSFSKILNALKPDGRLVTVGGEKGDWIAPLIKPIGTIFMQPFVDQQLIGFIASLNQDDLKDLAELMRDGKLNAVIDRQYSLAQTADAMAHSETGRARGKIIVNMQ